MALADRVGARTRNVRRTGDPVTMEEFGYLLGQGSGASRTKAGVGVSAMRALAIPSWWSGVRYQVDSAAFLPWRQFRGDQANRMRVPDPPWLEQPDTELPWEALIESWIMSIQHRGNGYAFKLRDGLETVYGLRALHPDRVKVGQAGDGTKVFQIDNRMDMGFTSREILHIPGLSYNGLVGLDPIRVLAETLGAISAAEEFGARSFGQGSHLQAYISVPQTLTATQAEELKAQWERFHKGIANAHEFGVLGNNAEYKTISLDPEQVQLLETRKWGVIEVAQMLRIPPHKLYELSRATFSNIEHQAIEAVTDSIRPLVQRIETYVNFDRSLNPRGYFIEADLEGMLRGDSAARADFNNKGITGGWLTPKWVAQKENAPAPDELDYFLRPLNMDVIRPGQVAQSDDTSEARAIAEMIQKIYLGVGKVITIEEARSIVNRGGGGLTGPGPQETP